jgi:hypothetical protein
MGLSKLNIFFLLYFSEGYSFALSCMCMYIEHEYYEQCHLFINFLTFRMEPATSQFSHQNVVTMKCLKSLCNGGDSLNKLNQLLRTTFPIVEVDLPNAKPTSASNRIIQEIHLGYLPLLVLSILNHLLN